MLIITEKPSVAKDFARALGCSYSSTDRAYKSRDGRILISNCVGHLFNLAEPVHYDARFKKWANLPVIPAQFEYEMNPATKATAVKVIKLIKSHKNDEILIATDADREGEIIARECLNASGISDYSKIKRFWVSQALTDDVILEGIKNARPDSAYEKLSQQGFSRQKSDWLVGINFTRFLTNKAGILLTAGRVQTAVLNAIAERCERIATFVPEKYYEHYGIFSAVDGIKCQGIYKDSEGKSAFSKPLTALESGYLCGRKARLKEKRVEEKKILPPLLYNLNELQKDAFKLFGYSADKTLNLVQSLYEIHKCVSYPRTPSKVMGSANTSLCESVFKNLSLAYPDYAPINASADFTLSNKRVFNDAKLEAHHAIIPLEQVPDDTNPDERNVYRLILERFMTAFSKPFVYEKQTVILDVGGNTFEVSGKKIIDEGWHRYCFVNKADFDTSDEEDGQSLSGIDFENLNLSDIETKEKMTKAPKHFNEASILAFMENPKTENTEEKLVGLGTPATRHTFIPKLTKAGYIEVKNKNILITKKGTSFLQTVKSSPVSRIADIAQTTEWEEQLDSNPQAFLEGIKEYVRNAIG